MIAIREQRTLLEYLNLAIAKFGVCATCRRMASMEKTLFNVTQREGELIFYQQNR